MFGRSHVWEEPSLVHSRLIFYFCNRENHYKITFCIFSNTITKICRPSFAPPKFFFARGFFFLFFAKFAGQPLRQRNMQNAVNIINIFHFSRFLCSVAIALSTLGQSMPLLWEEPCLGGAIVSLTVA
jgi:hypothetical protein